MSPCYSESMNTDRVLPLPERVTLVEVGPRDGLQNEAQPIAVADKLELVDQLADAGLPVIETGSFVSPKWVPQMAGTAELFGALSARESVRYTALTPNARGLEDAMQAGVKEVAVFAAVTESFSQRNLNCSVADSIDRYVGLTEHAIQNGLKVRGYLSCVLGCPYEGCVDPRVGK